MSGPILDLETAVREMGALPMPAGPEPRTRTMLDHARAALNARMTKDDLRLVLENTIAFAATLETDREANDREYEAATARIAALESERHTTNEALSAAAEQLRRQRDRIAELEKLVEQATEFRVWEPAYGLYVRRAPGTTGFAVMEARRTDKGRRVWTTSGWQYATILSDSEMFCWPDAQTAVTEARRIMPGGAA
ncbi:hypothetical protein [Streptomyces sp. E5N91]|uniref:hypothetical protein n=1 Tax=Streptomyces sp. E5N91 TaxID=1851996 RepID=UPI000EF58E10|nr:hypothetical protein [Streptomyces sp. E5N91]